MQKRVQFSAPPPVATNAGSPVGGELEVVDGNFQKDAAFNGHIFISARKIVDGDVEDPTTTIDPSIFTGTTVVKAVAGKKIKRFVFGCPEQHKDFGISEESSCRIVKTDNNQRC